MCKVTFRKIPELLTSMFTQDFKSAEEAKRFIKKDAKHYAKFHGFEKDMELVNEEPEDDDYFVLYHRCGVTRKAVLVYQYFHA